MSDDNDDDIDDTDDNDDTDDIDDQDQWELAPPLTETITIEINRATLDRVEVRYPNRSKKITQDLNRYYYFLALGRTLLQKKFTAAELNYLER